MFDIRQVDFSNGVMAGNRINGIEVMAMQEAENADKIVNDFEQILQNEMSPYAAFEQALRNNNLTEDDFSTYEFEKLNRRVNAIYKAKQMNEDY